MTFQLVAVLTLIAACSLQVWGLKCEERYSYRQGSEGSFHSPNFPNPYPELVTCHFHFEAPEDGRVRIEFDFFDLEGHSANGESEHCKFDYIEVYSVDRKGQKTQLRRCCGGEVPKPIVSMQSQLEIVFVSDYTKTETGFLAKYKFLDDTWSPFDPPSPECGDSNLSGTGGVIATPEYPSPYPPWSKCTWSIRVKDGQHIMLTLIDMDLGSDGLCRDTKLLIYDGIASPEVAPARRWCGQSSNMRLSQRGYKSTSSRVVIRFTSGLRNDDMNRGFRMSWTAAYYLEDGACHDFVCQGGRQQCEVGQECTEPRKSCIHYSLRCDGVLNCGPLDSSDERKCPREILIMTAFIALPSLAVVTLIIVVIICYRRKHVRKSTSQEQPLTTNHREASGETRPRSACLMHTSFMDSRGQSEDELDPPLPPPPPPEEVNNVEARPHTPEPNLGPRQKRASYHMMKQACLEDGNSMIVADI